MESAESRARSFLTTLASQENVPSSLLIYGPKGSRRFEVALHLVKEVNGDDEDRRNAIDRDDDPDLTVINPDGTSVKVRQIRDLLGVAYKGPLIGPKRFLIVREADKLTYQASQALLKAAEDTPDSTTLILLTSNPHQIPKTLESRLINVCVRQSSEDIREEIDAEGDKAEMAIRMGCGSLKRAQSLLTGDTFDEIEGGLKSVRRNAAKLLIATLRSSADEYLGVVRDLDEEEIEETFHTYMSFILDVVLYLRGSDWLRHPDFEGLYEDITEDVDEPDVEFLTGLMEYQKRMRWNVASRRQLNGLLTYVWRWNRGI